MNGLVELFHRRSVMITLEACYGDPLSIDASWLCLLYLIFAIGLVMATPIPGSPENAIIQKLRNDKYDRAEIFYSDAKQLADPSSGFEDAGFWSIQALTLMSIYTLAISKRNAAYAYYGKVVRSIMPSEDLHDQGWRFALHSHLVFTVMRLCESLISVNKPSDATSGVLCSFLTDS
jgi:hypothetical protein